MKNNVSQAFKKSVKRIDEIILDHPIKTLALTSPFLIIAGSALGYFMR